MWEAVRYGDVDYYEDRRALDALIAAVPSEMQFSLSKKRTAKDAWDAIAVARIGSDALARPRYRHFTRSGRTWPSSQVRMLMTSLSILTLCSRRWCSLVMRPTARREPSISSSGASPRSTSRSLARSIESLLDLSMMSIEEAIGRLKVIDGDEPQPLSGPITVDGKLHLTREQWEACQGDGKKGESLP
jgi:hypothetical protein